MASDSSSSSSSEDEEHNAALRSVAIDSSAVVKSAAAPTSSSKRKSKSNDEETNGEDDKLKYSQIRLQDLLHKHLDKSLGLSFVDVVTADDCPAIHQRVEENPDFDGSVRLFRCGPLGISLKQPERPKVKRPARYESSDEDSSERNKRLQAAAIEGTTVLTQAEGAKAKARARYIIAETAAKEAAREEENRVAKLKKERGEAWLPSIAAELKQLKAAQKKRNEIGKLIGKVVGF